MASGFVCVRLPDSSNFDSWVVFAVCAYLPQTANIQRLAVAS